jgi:GxxExxY protein
MQNDDLTSKIIGAAYKVYNTMGFGYLESVYRACMLIELRKLGLDVREHYPIKVNYEGHPVGDFEADLFVEEQVMVELKSIRTLNPIHEVQLVNYLKATGVDLGLLINFGEQKSK